MEKRIAMIDSGVGGLTLFQQLIKHRNCITYVADNRYFPYGVKKDSDLINIIDRLIYHFLNHQYKKVILSCNTASLIYNKYLKYKYQDLVVSIIESTVNDLDKIKHFKHVGVIATNQITKHHVYEDLIKEKYNVKVTTIPASPLVSYCESDDKHRIKHYIDTHFHVLKKSDIDVLILGCTHFNLIEDEMKKFLNSDIPIICSGYSIISQFILNDLCLMCNKNEIYITDYQPKYVNTIKYLFKDLKKIKIQALNIPLESTL